MNLFCSVTKASSEYITINEAKCGHFRGEKNEYHTINSLHISNLWSILCYICLCLVLQHPETESGKEYAIGCVMNMKECNRRRGTENINPSPSPPPGLVLDITKRNMLIRAARNSYIKHR